MKKWIKLFLWISILVLIVAIDSNASSIDKSDFVLRLGDNRAYVGNQLVFIDDKNKEVVPIIRNDRTLVPVRFIAERYADSILWDGEEKKVTINSGKKQIIIFIGSNEIYINNAEKLIDAEAIIINERTYLPLRAICEALGKYVFYDNIGLIIISDKEKSYSVEDINKIVNMFAKPIDYEVVDYNGKKLNIIRINPKDPSIRLEVALPNDRLNSTDNFLSIVSRKGAYAAINANFFTAYDAAKDPVGHVISDGKVIYGQSGLDSVLIMEDGGIRFLKPTIHIIGTTNNRDSNVYLGKGRFDYYLWAAYGINVLEQDPYSAMLYTSERGDTVNITTKGYVITVEDGIITSNALVDTPQEVSIPKNGYVILIGEDENKLSLSAEALKVGRTVQMNYRILDENKNEIDANDVRYALSGGPELISNGEKVIGLTGTFDNDTRFTSLETRRTAIGIDENGMLMLVYVSKANIDELKDIMKWLGSVDAINLDGGASSAMYYNGSTIVSPGRQLTTILYIYLD